MEWLVVVAVDVFLSAVILMVLTAILPGLKIDDLVTALMAALLILVARRLLGLLLSPVIGPSEGVLVVTLLLSVLASAIGLVVALAFLPGLRLEGSFAVAAVAIVLLGVIRFGIRYGLAWLQASGVLVGLTG